MNYRLHKSFKESLQELIKSGGPYKKAGDKIRRVIGDISLSQDENITSYNPLSELQMTNHGETRIKHCIKYQLPGGCRLITIVNNGLCIFVYAGKHENCERWLNKKKGMEFVVDTKSKELLEVYTLKDNGYEGIQNIKQPNYEFQGPLFEKLPKKYSLFLEKEIGKKLIINSLKNLKSIFEDEDLEMCLELIQDEHLQDTVFEVFLSLREGNISNAKRIIDLYKRELKKVEELAPNEIAEMINSDSFSDDFELINKLWEHYFKTSVWEDWMVFVHPKQKEAIETDFSGPAKLAGVSGSGKTVIIVHRSIRLAQKYSTEKILIITLNVSLASLIQQLIFYACPEKEIRDRIIIKSFWKLCQEKLLEFITENNIEARNLRSSYKDATIKTEEHIDQIWQEFYHCEANNNDAEVLLPVHKTLNVRNIKGANYLRQEFQWIRSALPPNMRKKYLKIERTGRKVPFDLHYRKLVLKGLEGWEDKMFHVGVSDYLRLTSDLWDYSNDLTPEYRSILVDEVQDFGTLELAIIRKLVREGENDIFLCGDIAQQVYSKHHNLNEANIEVSKNRTFAIFKNYRNSREILAAADSMLKNNIDLNNIESEDFKVLNPEYSNFSSPIPRIHQAKGGSLHTEVWYAINYLETNYSENPNFKGCLAFAGLTLFQVKSIGKLLRIPVLDESVTILENSVFLSDLEQTKGFEFNTVIILNCESNTIPNPKLPEEEWFRDVSKLYVAMTRARHELIISYHDSLSKLLQNLKDLFLKVEWSDYSELEVYHPFEIPRPSEYENNHFDNIINNIRKYDGRKIIYSDYALGMTPELQEKLELIITGKNKIENKNQVEFKSLQELIDYGRTKSPELNTLFGPETYKKFKEIFGGLDSSNFIRLNRFD